MRPKFFTYLVTISTIITTIYPPSILASGIIVDPRSGTVTLDNAQNGVRVINIAAPNSRGMSHNRFKDFNVDKNGVILNNAKQEGISVLGGAILKNPNLNGRDGAVLILNEVTGVNRSNVNGFTEVHGRRADYVLANPNGITCNGCGFINVNRATLSTGRPEIENGFLKNLNVEGGDVTIGSAGLNAENVNYFEIISRTAKLQGQINADELDIVTGRNDYNYESKQVTAKSDTASKPELSIDASSLGSIYAGRIKMISTEAGVGVNVPNDMYADAGDVIIDSKGNLTYGNLTANGKVDLKSVSKITGTGSTAATGNININAGELEFTSSSTLVSHGDIDMNAGNISNAGSITSSGQFSIRSFHLINSGELLSNGPLSVVSDQLNNEGVVLSGSDVFVNSVSLVNTGEFTASDDLDLIFAQFDNSGFVLAGNLVDITGDEFNNSLTGELISYKDINIDTANLINNGTASSAEVLNINSSTAENMGQIISEQDILFNTGFLLNSGDILSNNSFSLNATSLTNTGSILSASVDINSSINNSNIIEGDYVWLKGNILNTGKVNGWSLLDIDTSSLDNTNGEFLAGVLTKLDGKYTDVESFGDLNLNYNGALTLSGKYFATGDMNISATSIDNRTNLTSLYGLNINTGLLVNQHGTMMAGVNNHPEFTLNTYGTLNIDATNITNRNLMYATGLVDIDLTGTLNNYNVIFSKDEMDIYAGSKILNADNSYIYSIGNMNLATASSGNIDNNLGVIKTEYGNMNINTGTFYNRSTLVGKPHPIFPGWIPGTFEYLTFTEYNGQWLLSSDDQSGVTFLYTLWGDYTPYDNWHYVDQETGEYNPDASVIEITREWTELGRRYAYSNLTTSDYSVLRSGGNLTMNVGTLHNSSSDILAAGNITINASNKIDNSRAGHTVYNLPVVSLRIKPGVDDSIIKLFYVKKEFNTLLDGEYWYPTIWDGNAGSSFWGSSHVDSYSYLLNNFLDLSITYGSQAISSDRASRIIAGGNVSLNKTQLGDAPTSHTASSNTFYTDVSSKTNQNYAVNTSVATLNAGVNNLSFADRRIDVDGVFFRYVSGASYLIESNPLFVDLNGLMSSNYFLERAGYSKDQFNRLFMGDAYWEKEYIAKQIEQEFNRKFIFDEVDSDAMQRELLLTNAMDIAGELKLKLGLGLTEEQRKALKQPIVWYVEQEQVVNGKKVSALVPKIYSPITSDFTVQLAGGILSGKNISISTDTDVQVGGIMYADGTTSVKARDFNLDTAQLRTGKLNVSLDRDLNIRASDVNVLDSAVLVTKGSINIDGVYSTDRKLTTTADGSSLLTQNTNYIGSKLSIGKDLLVMAGNNFGLMGSDINVGGSAQFDVKGDMVLASAEESTLSERRKFEAGTWSSTLTKENHYTTTQKGANLNVGNNLTINTGKSLTLVASDITADNVYVEAKGDINLLSKMDETNDSLSVVKTGMLSKKIDETTDYTGTNVGSSIKANNTNYIKADGNVNLVASELASENGTLAIEANDVNLLSANDVIGHSEYHKSISYFSLGSIFGSLGSFMTGGDLEFGSFKEDTVVTSEEIAKGSSIRGPTLFVKTKNDMNLIGSNIYGNDVTLSIGRDLNLLSAAQQSDYLNESKEGKLFLNFDITGISGVSVKGGVKYTESKESTKTVTNVGSGIQAGNLKVSTGRDMLLVGSSVVAETQDIAVGRDLKLMDVQDTVEHSMESTDVRTGVELRLTSNPLSVVDGIAGLGKTVFTGQMFKGINGAVGSFNDTLTNFGKINQGYDTNEKGELGLFDGSGSLNYFLDISKHTENTNTTKSVGSYIFADKSLNLTTGNDLLIYGSNINAGTADVNVGGDLDIRSSFDTSKHDSSDVNVSMKVALIGGDVGNPNISGSGVFTSSESKWVNNLAGIQTTDGANIVVKGNTNLEGGMINDLSSKLTLNTGSLTFKDLEGYENSQTYGGGRSIDLDLGNQSTNIKYAMVDKDQVARATIGEGTIVVGGQSTEVEGLNRDINKTLEVTKNDSIDIDVDIDDRVLSSKGWDDIAKTFKQGGVNLGSMADSLAKAVSDSGDGVNGLGGGVSYSEAKINITKTVTQMAENGSDYDKDQLEILSNPASYSAEELQGASDYLIKSIASKYGYSDDELNDLKLIVYNDLSDNDAGFREKDKPANEGTIGLNAAHTGLGTDAYYFTLGHEFGHLHQAQDGAEQNEAYSDTIGNAFIHSINDGLYVGGMDSVNTRFFSTGLEDSGNYLFTYGNNAEARSIVQRDPYLFTAIDILSLGMGINNIKNWDEKTSFSERLADAGGVLLDAGGLFFPGTLAVGMQLTAYRAASKLDNVLDVSKVANKADNLADVTKVGNKVAGQVDDAAEFYMKKVDQLDVSTKRNSAVFYSGEGNRKIAEEFASQHGKTTLEMTPGGKWLDEQKLFSEGSLLTKDQARQVWEKASKKFADEASGSATGFVKGARKDGIFNIVESPALEQNKNITNLITGGN